MPVSKRNRSKFYQYAVTVDGERLRGSTKCTSRTGALAFEARVITEFQEKGIKPLPNRRSITLSAYIPKFKTWVDESHKLTFNGKRYYRGGIDVLLRSSLAAVPIIRITEDLVDVTTFTEVAGAEASGHLSNQAISTLRRILNKAKAWGDLHDVPKMHLRKAPGRTALITEEIESKLIAHLQRPEKNRHVLEQRERLIDVYLMIHDAGVRTSEAVSARVENVDWLGRRMLIERGKTKNATRWVALSDRLLARLQFRCHGRTSGFVYASKRAKSGHYSWPQHAFRRACRAAGIPDEIILYTGRHTYGTATVADTGNVFAVQTSMGHADIKSMVPYQHQNTSVLADAQNRRNSQRHTLRHTPLPIQ